MRSEQTDHPCPVCGIGLFDVATVDMLLLGCGKCGGQWLDNLGCQRIVTACIGDYTKEMATRASARAAQPASDDPGGPYRAATDVAGTDARACPICRAVLVKHVSGRSKVEIDVCAAHGAWFDPHELLRLARWYENEHAAKAADIAEQRRRVEETASAEARGRLILDIITLGGRHSRSTGDDGWRFDW